MPRLWDEHPSIWRNSSRHWRAAMFDYHASDNVPNFIGTWNESVPVGDQAERSVSVRLTRCLQTLMAHGYKAEGNLGTR